MHTNFRDATGHDWNYFVPRLRQADLTEMKIMTHGMDPWHVLGLGMAQSKPCKVVEINHEPIAICGIVPEEALIGRAWLVGTDGIEKYALTFLRNCKRWHAELCEGYAMVHNYVHAENKLHVRWLRDWLGCSWLPNLEVDGHEFLHFYQFLSCVHPSSQSQPSQ